MKVLHVLKTKPDDITESLMSAVSDGEEGDVFKLYDVNADYGALLDSVFSHDKVISWW